MQKKSIRAVLLGTCSDQRGLVAQLSRFIFDRGGNIVDSDQHTDHEAGIFATRLEWELNGFQIPRHNIEESLTPLLKNLGMKWSLRFTDQKPRIAVWGSKQEHCLLDLLGRQSAGDLQGEIRVIMSNHDLLAQTALRFDIPFAHIPITRDTRHEGELKQLKVLEEHQIELVILAKYMQILSGDFLRRAPQVINIHHSFLPAFPGASPYHQAFSRGVKIIGATAHFVTEVLDDGPIIDQDVCRVSHRDSVEDMVRKGKDLEKVVLARAIHLYLDHRVLVYGNKTIVFE
jgi:formyltetrahydrofolate deformylase